MASDCAPLSPEHSFYSCDSGGRMEYYSVHREYVCVWECGCWDCSDKATKAVNPGMGPVGEECLVWGLCRIAEGV